MVKLDLDQVVLRRMKEDDIETVKALIKEGCEGTENRLVLHILTRPLCLFILAILSSVLRFLVHSFILALAVPVFLLIVFLKVTMPRSTGVLGTSRPYWDYVGSSHRGAQEEMLPNPYTRISGKKPQVKKVCSLLACETKPRRRPVPKEKQKEAEREASPETVDQERERAAGQVWVADYDEEIAGCVSRESERRPGIRRLCRLVVGSWYRREGLGRLLVQGLEQREREGGARRLYAHTPYPSKAAEAFFRKLGYRQLGEEGADDDDDDDDDGEEGDQLETPERGFLGFPLTKVFYKDL